MARRCVCRNEKESDVMNMEPKLVEEVTQIATLKAIEVFNAQKEEELQREKDKRLHNTKLLLKNYTNFQKYVEEEIMNDLIREEEDIPIHQLVLNERDIVSSIRMSKGRTIEMLNHLDNALETMKQICEQDGSKHYDILQKRFIDGESISNLAEEYAINERSIYKLIDAAASRLSVLLFGIYGLKIE